MASLTCNARLAQVISVELNGDAVIFEQASKYSDQLAGAVIDFLVRDVGVKSWTSPIHHPRSLVYASCTSKFCGASIRAEAIATPLTCSNQNAVRISAPITPGNFVFLPQVSWGIAVAVVER
jgi:hypothetical protein